MLKTYKKKKKKKKKKNEERKRKKRAEKILKRLQGVKYTCYAFSQ